MEFTAQITVRQKWIDPRLMYNRQDSHFEYVVLDDVLGEKLWTPDLFFDNEATAFVHKMMKPNTYKWVYPDGKVLWSTRLTVTFACPMYFHYFPFDRQMCNLKMESYSGTSKSLIILWDDEDEPVGFDVKDYRGNFKFDLEKHETGMYYFIM